MRKNKFFKTILTMVLCMCTFIFTGCIPSQTTNTPPPAENPPPSTPDIGGDGTATTPNIDDLFQGIKIISSGGNDLTVRDYNGDEKQFNVMLDRQIDAYAQDLLIRLIAVYGGVGELNKTNEGVEDYLKIKDVEGDVYNYNENNAILNLQKFLSNGKYEQDSHITGSNINLNCENCMNFYWNRFSFNNDRSLNLKLAMLGGRKLKFTNETAMEWKNPEINTPEQWNNLEFNTSDSAWLWKIDLDPASFNKILVVMEKYLTQYKDVFKKVLAEILAYGETKEYNQSIINENGTVKGYNDNFDYTATLNKIDHLGILANDSKNIKNFVLSEIIGEDLVKKDNTRKPQVLDNKDVNLTTVNFDLATQIKDKNLIFSTVIDASKGDYYELLLNEDKTYSYNSVDWQNNKTILSFGTYLYNVSTSDGLSLSFTQNDSLGTKTTTGTMVKNPTTKKITLEAEIGNIGRKSFVFDGNGIMSYYLKDNSFIGDDFTKTDADGNLDFSKYIISEKRYFSNYSFIVSSIINRVQFHTFGNVGEAPKKNIDSNIEGENGEFVSIYPKMPRVVSNDKAFNELSDIGGVVNPDTGEKIPGIMFTEYQEFKSIIYKPKVELICPELWLAFSAEKDMRVTLQVNFKYVANGKVLYNNILGSNRNTTNDDKSIFVIERDYNLVSKTNNIAKSFNTLGKAGGYPDVELPDNLKPDPNNRDYFFDFSLYEVIENLHENMFKPYNDSSNNEYNIWNSSFTTSPKKEGAGSIAGYNAGENYIEVSFIILNAEKIVGSNYMPYNGPVKLSIGFGEPFV